MLTLHQRQRAQEFVDTVPAELTADELADEEPDDDLACAAGIVRAVVWSAAIYAVGIVAWLLLAR